MTLNENTVNGDGLCLFRLLPEIKFKGEKNMWNRKELKEKGSPYMQLTDTAL